MTEQLLSSNTNIHPPPLFTVASLFSMVPKCDVALLHIATRIPYSHVALLLHHCRRTPLVLIYLYTLLKLVSIPFYSVCHTCIHTSHRLLAPRLLLQPCRFPLAVSESDMTELAPPHLPTLLLGS